MGMALQVFVVVVNQVNGFNFSAGLKFAPDFKIFIAILGFGEQDKTISDNIRYLDAGVVAQTAFYCIYSTPVDMYYQTAYRHIYFPIPLLPLASPRSIAEFKKSGIGLNLSGG
jgi:hypothetical protein